MKSDRTTSKTDFEPLLKRFDMGDLNVDGEISIQLAKLAKQAIRKTGHSHLFDSEQYRDIASEVYTTLLATRGQVREETVQSLIKTEVNKITEEHKKTHIDSEKIESIEYQPKTYIERPFLFGDDDIWRLARLKICTDAGASLETWDHFFLHMIARKRYFGWAVPRIKPDQKGGDHTAYYHTLSPHILTALQAKQRHILTYHDSRTDPERLLIEIMISTFALLMNITCSDRRFGNFFCDMIFDGASLTLQNKLTGRRKIWNKTLDDLDPFCRKLLRAKDLVSEDQFLPETFDAAQSIGRARAFFRAYESSPPWFQTGNVPEISAEAYVRTLIQEATQKLEPVKRESRQRILELTELEYRREKTYSEIIQLGALALPSILESIRSSRDLEFIQILLTILEHMGKTAKPSIPLLANILKVRKADKVNESAEIVNAIGRAQRYLQAC